MEQNILELLVDITGSEEVYDDPSLDLFEEGMLDSLGTVQLLVELEGKFGVQVPISEFERSEWNTPEKIIQQVKVLEVR